MCQLIIHPGHATVNPDPIQDRKGRYQKGYVVEVRDDSAPWGGAEASFFYRVLIPNIPADRARKYLDEWYDVVFPEEMYQRRIWKLRIEDLPISARQKLTTTRTLTIKAAPTYKGSYDFTWVQVRNYIRNLLTGQDESTDL